jgi:glutamine cyclotransferase
MFIRLFRIILIVFILNFILGCKDKSVYDNSEKISIPVIDYKYLKSYPHDTTSFTEGLLIHDSKLYESTGSPSELSYTKSLFGVVDLTTGKIDAKVVLDREKYFGEGIAFLNGKAYQLTYKMKVGFVYDAKTFRLLRKFTIPSKEGWGLTTDGTNLIMSDGTYILTYLDPESLQVTKTVSVTENGNAKEYLNELEFINGYIYANIWTTNTIVKINPEDGKVVGFIDMNDLSLEAKYLYPHSLEMNGIAYDSITKKIYVTGKLWPKIYEIELDN